MSPEMREFLTKMFMDGERTGQKVNAYQCVRIIRAEGKFDVSEWRTEKQIAGFFSKLAAQRKQNIVEVEDEDEDDAANDEVVIEQEIRDK